MPLPVRLGFDPTRDREQDGDDRDDEDRERRVLLRKRWVPAATVRKAVQSAAGLCRRFEKWPERAPLARHLELLGALLREGLEWPEDHPLTTEIQARLETGARGLEAMDLTWEDLHLVLRELFAEIGRERLGGQGAGVQILDATEARGRTFDHLFLIGLNGGMFPRTVREDPLLGDPIRRLLSRHGFGVLPDLPAKREGAEEERYLFAQLLSAAPAITLSWQQVDDDNGARTVSPLVERLRWSSASPFAADVPLVRPPHAPGPAAGPGNPEAPPKGLTRAPRPLLERAVEVALDGDRDALEPILALGLADLPEGRETAAARRRILDEMDPPARRTGLGPYLGMVGSTLGDDDPRRNETLFVTTLEAMCGCPWQTLLTRLLRIEPLPDPLETLPAISSLLVGNVVHRAAQAVVERRLGRSSEKVPPRGRLALPVSWPGDEALEEILLEAAAETLRDSGIGLPGFDRVVAMAVRPYLDELGRFDWPDGARVSVLGVEVRDHLELGGGQPPRRLAFRADRVDGPGESPLYTDYKTGRRSISGSEDVEKLRRKVLTEVGAGLRLQVPAYVLAGGGSGRYLFLHPEVKGARSIAIDKAERQTLAAFRRAVDVALTAWREGAFPPRVVEADRDHEPRRCDWCEVAQACVRGDSGARRRLRDWAAAVPADAPAGPAAAALEVWRLPLEETDR